MFQAGYPPKMLQEILGHASIITTLDTGGTLAATTGATLKELIGRLGHSNPRAAMI